MKRLRRCLVNGIAVISLLLGLTTVGLWARSYWKGEGLEWCARGGRWTTLFSSHGRLGAYWGEMRCIIAVGPVRSSFDDRPLFMPRPGITHHWRCVGFEWLAAVHSNVFQVSNITMWVAQQSVAVPDWAAVLALAILPFYRFTAMRRLHLQTMRKRLDLCLSCGYDLGATPDRCPECGTMQHKTAK